MNNIKKYFTFIILAIIFLGGLYFTTSSKRKEAKEKQDALEFIELAFNQKQIVKAFGSYVGPYYRQHNPHVPDGKEAAISILSQRIGTLNIKYYVKRTMADGDLVTIHSYVTMDSDPKQRAVIDIFRFEKGKIVEHWDVVQEVPKTSANNNTMF